MNQSYRKQVDDYLKSDDVGSTEPLGFYKQIYNYNKLAYDNKPVEVSDLSIKELGLKQVIINILNYTIDYSSGTNGNIETCPNSLRSALDIWRHIKKYNSVVSIYQVMKCIANNAEEMNLYSHFCCTIERRVFRIADDDDYPQEINDDYDEDEFGLKFYEWSEL
jgi:hypothetical protein